MFSHATLYLKRCRAAAFALWHVKADKRTPAACKSQRVGFSIVSWHIFIHFQHFVALHFYSALQPIVLKGYESIFLKTIQYLAIFISLRWRQFIQEWLLSHTVINNTYHDAQPNVAVRVKIIVYFTQRNIAHRTLSYFERNAVKKLSSDDSPVIFRTYGDWFTYV